MRKIKLYTLAIIDGLILIAAVTATILGLVHSISTSAEYLLLMLTPCAGGVAAYQDKQSVRRAAGREWR